MITAFRDWRDQILGRGKAACTVPIFDGPLKPNQLLETASIAYQAREPRDLTSDGRRLWLADGLCVLELSEGMDGKFRTREVYRAESPITALCTLPVALGGGLAIAVGGRELRLIEETGATRHWREARGRPFIAINAITTCGDGLIVSDGSAVHAPDEWQRDLMTLGCSGRICRLDIASGQMTVLADRLQHAFGVAAIGETVWLSESWRHRVVALGADGRLDSVLDQLPGYPSRIVPASGGGCWLTVFGIRTQLVEFVLREPRYRERMVVDIPPELWIAPQLRPRQSFQEPLQFGSVRQMGVLKPWSPPRSYGLVVRLGPTGQPMQSLHSRADGRHHGITAIAECGGRLYVLSRGSGCVLHLDQKSMQEQETFT